MTGDTSNLLGLGSFSTDAAGNADYTEITAGTAYSAATVTGSATTTGLAAGLEISLNGQQATALTAIDLTAGANAVAASATSSASIGAGTADISATNNNLDITVTNNGVATHKIFSLTTNQLATNGTVASTIAGLTNGASFTGYAATALAHNDTFTVSVDGGAAQNVTVDGTFAAGATGAGLFMTALQAALPAGVTAGWDATTNELTFTSGTTGAHSSVALGAATYASSASAWMTTTSANIVTTPVIVANASNNNKFNLAVDGGASVTLTVADGTYNTAAGFLSAINNAISGAGLAASVTAGWDPISNEMTLTTVSTGAASSLAVSAVAGNTGLTNIGYMASTNHGSATAANTGLTHFALNANTTAVAGQNDAPTTVQSIATQIATQLGASAAVTVSNDNKISIASTTKGANSLVTINTPGTNSANGTLHLTTPTPVAGLNSSIGDIVNNLNAQFAANSTYQNAGLKAVATLSDGTGSGSFLTIQSNNGTQFRLNAVGAPAAATAGAYASTVTQSSIAVSTPLAVTLNTNDKFNIAVDGGSATQVQVAASSYTTAGAFLIAVNAAITGSALTGLVTAGWDATTGALTLTSATTGGNSSVAVSAVGGNTGMTHLGFSAGTNSGHQVEVTENTGYGVAGASFTAATPGSSGTAMSTLNAYGISNSGAFTFSALQYGSDKQALTFSATDANGTLETETITLQNNASVNRAGASIDDAVAYLNQQLQQTTANPALQKIVAVKQANTGGTAEAINFVSSLSNFTVGVAATANGDGLNSGLATYRTSAANGSGANMSIDTAAGAMAAITAIAAAIDKLGAAQATIGKGENQLTYAVNLAQSQITNFSAAESQIRDANVAQQAANLSKAQVLTQASIAAMAQANSAPQAVLTLLRG
jgi:flagellin